MGRRKPGPVQDPDAIAQVLVDALLLGDELAAQKHSLSTRTIGRYRAKMRADKGLSELVQAKKARAAEGWEAELQEAIRLQVDFLRRSALKMDPSKPDAVHAAAGALKIMSETSLTGKVVNARLPPTNRGVREGAPAVATPGGSTAEGAPRTVH